MSKATDSVVDASLVQSGVRHAGRRLVPFLIVL